MLPLKHMPLLCSTRALRKGIGCFTNRNGPVCSVLHLKLGQKFMHFSQLGAVEEMCFGTILSNGAACTICRVLAAI